MSQESQKFPLRPFLPRFLNLINNDLYRSGLGQGSSKRCPTSRISEHWRRSLLISVWI